MWAIFERHDADQDGLLVKQEVEAAMNEAGIVMEHADFEYIFECLEARLSYSDFQTMCALASSRSTPV